MEKKTTKKEMYAIIIDTIANEMENPPKHADEIVKFCQHEIEQLDKKTASRSTSKAQKEGQEAKDLILEVLTMYAGEKFTVGEILKKDSRFTEKDISSARATAQLQKLLKEGAVQNEKDKKRSLYFVK